MAKAKPKTASKAKPKAAAPARDTATAAPKAAAKAGAPELVKSKYVQTSDECAHDFGMTEATNWERPEADDSGNVVCPVKGCGAKGVLVEHEIGKGSQGPIIVRVAE